MAEMGVLVAYLSCNAVAIIVAVANLCLAIVVAVADLPAAAVCVGVAAVLCSGAYMDLAGTVLPFIAFMVCCAVSLPCHALLGYGIATCPLITIIVVQAEPRLWLAVVGLDVAYLPGFAVTIYGASFGHRIASPAHDVASLPGFAISVCCAVARGRFACVGNRIAVFEDRLALGIRIAVARGRAAVLGRIAHLPYITIGITPASVLLEGTLVGCGDITLHQRIIAVGILIAVAREGDTGAGGGIAELPGFAVGVDFTAYSLVTSAAR